VLQALRTSEVTALEKDAQDVRPVAVGSTLRRLGLRALLKVKKDEISAVFGEHPYGVGRKGGAQLLAQKLKVQAELRPDAVFVKVDQKAAFQKVGRGPAVAAAVAEVPELAGPLHGWYSGRTKHLWRGADGKFEELCATRGFDQGCPLAAAVFSISQKTALAPWLTQVLAMTRLRSSTATLATPTWSLTRPSLAKP
jgi:hypothetical protein